MNQPDKQKVLVIDDDPFNLKSIAACLKGECSVILAKSGAEGLQLARRNPQPDLILLDVVMPDMDGYEVIKKLKRDNDTHDIPVIFVTGLESNEEQERGLVMGGIDYITKPIYPPIVKARVKNHLELVRNRKLLQSMAHVDGLTGIPNRRNFDQSLTTEWQRSIRNTSEISLLMIDIDFFKQYNDVAGHAKGDQALIKVAQALNRSILRPQDLCARFGGEEFAILLPQTDENGAKCVANKALDIIKNLEIPHPASTCSDFITVSIGGYTTIPKRYSNAIGLVERADHCLYEAKHQGRNRVIMETETDIESSAKLLKI